RQCDLVTVNLHLACRFLATQWCPLGVYTLDAAWVPNRRSRIPDMAAGSALMAHPPSVGQCTPNELAAMCTITQRMDADRNRHAWPERPLSPALPCQVRRSQHLDRPELRLAAFRNCQHDPGMRIGPLEFVDGALQGHRPAAV